jgi:DNA-binding MarR family transcriptional regulator
MSAHKKKKGKEDVVPVTGLLHGELDPVIHTRIRLGMLSALSAGGKMTFNDLKETLQTTDGNLSVHARKLEEAGYVSASKSFVDRMPLTTFKLTATGRRALSDYLDQMEAIIRIARG